MIRSAAAIWLCILCFFSPAVADETAAPHRHVESLMLRASLTGVSSQHENDTDFLNNAARFLAGMAVPVESLWHPPASTAVWKKYAAESDQKWSLFFKTRGRAVAQWRARELARFDDTRTVFYPFSGPDFLYANILFPNADTYVLIGLEPVGRLPDPAHFENANTASCLRQIAASLEDILQISFFKTNDMAVELGNGCVPGTLPLLMIFLSRTGHHIEQVRFFDVADNGTTLHRPSQDACKSRKGMCRGVSIACSTAAGTPRTLVYLSADLSDNGFSRCQGCAAFCEALHPPIITLVKSASYLMHKGYFSRIRTIILQKSNVIAQDDSAIPFRYFKTGAWDITLYGSYTGPIGMFKDHFEKDLEAAYHRGASPLPFRFGYAQRSNLLIAVREESSRLP